MSALLLTTFSCKLTVNFSQVWPPKASSVEDSQRKLDNLLESGDVNKAMQIAFSLMSAAGDSVSPNYYYFFYYYFATHNELQAE